MLSHWHWTIQRNGEMGRFVIALAKRVLARGVRLPVGQWLPFRVVVDSDCPSHVLRKSMTA